MFGAVCERRRCSIAGRHAHVGDIVYALADDETNHSRVCWKAPVPPSLRRKPEPVHRLLRITLGLEEFADDLEPVTGER